MPIRILVAFADNATTGVVRDTAAKSIHGQGAREMVRFFRLFMITLASLHLYSLLASASERPTSMLASE